MNPFSNLFLPAAVNLFVRAIPAHLMAYYPFRDRLRLPFWKIFSLVCFIQVLQSILYGYMVQQGSSGRAAEFGFAFVYMGIYFFFICDDHYKLLFLYLFVMDYVMILRGISSFLEVRLFYHPDMNFSSWRSTLIVLVSTLVSAPFMLHFFARTKEQVFHTDAPAFWRTVWLVPAFTTAIVISFTAHFTVEQVRSFRFLFSRVLLLLCVFMVYAILLDALDAVRQQAALSEQTAMQEHLLAIQKLQYKQLLRYIEEAKTVRHDLRQHLGVIRAYIKNGETEKLLHYLNDYETILPTNTKRIFCANFAVNAVLTYYAEEARKQKIDFDVTCPLPEQLPAHEPEICALLGNLLENAIDSCKELTNTVPFIRISITCKGRIMLFTVDNSCQSEPKQKNGRFLSTKHDGYGTGTYSVKATAERSGGSVKFEYKDGVFYTSVLLYGNLS